MLLNKLFQRRKTIENIINNETEDDENKIKTVKLTQNKKSYKFGSGLIEILFWKIFIQETPHVSTHH
jgi:hypothetical protein